MNNRINLIKIDLITDEGIMNMINLKILNASYNKKITDKSVENFYLDELDCSKNPNITHNGIKHMDLTSLVCYNKNIEDKTIKNMVNLCTLFASPKMTNNGIKHLDLHKLYLYNNKLITDEGIKHMKLDKVLTGSKNFVTNKYNNIKVLKID